MNVICQAEQRDLNQIKELWHLAFEEDKSYIDAYFLRRSQTSEVWVKKQDGKIVSMVTLIPMQLCDPAMKPSQAMMIYGFATHPDWQGQGVGSLFLQEVLEMLWKRSFDAVLLVPASESLFEYYRGRGFQDYFFHYCYTNQGNGSCLQKSCVTSLPQWTKTDVRQYQRIREALLQGRRHVCFREEEICFQQFLSQYSGADLYCFESMDQVGCASIERLPGESLLIKEFLYGPGEAWDSLTSLLSLFEYKKLEIRSLMSRLGDVEGVKRNFGMVAFSNSHKTNFVDNMFYLGLGFD